MPSRSSPHAIIPFPTAMAYNMSKAAIDHMARTAAIELIKSGIRVNVFHPGWIDTPGERKFFTEEQLAEGAQTLPMGRLGTSEEMAHGVAFTLSNEAGYMTGRPDHGWRSRTPVVKTNRGKTIRHHPAVGDRLSLYNENTLPGVTPERVFDERWRRTIKGFMDNCIAISVHPHCWCECNGPRRSGTAMVVVVHGPLPVPRHSARESRHRQRRQPTIDPVTRIVPPDDPEDMIIPL